MEEIKELYDKEYVSLGLFKPKEVIDLEIRRTEDKWNDDELMKLGQLGLFDNKNVKQLEKVPWRFSYKFRCDDDKCSIIHNLKITDWEIYQTYRSFKQKYGNEQLALQKLKQKWLDYYFNNSEREAYFIVGTVYPRPTFIILGVVSYSTKCKNKNVIFGQQDLFSGIGLGI